MANRRIDRAPGRRQSSRVTPSDLDRLRGGIRDVPDFPKPGIVFKDIVPLLSDPALFRLAIDGLVEAIGSRPVDKIVGIDARGFIFGAAVADRIGAGLIPVRKPGKLPWKTRSAAYTLEYGESVVEIHEDAISPGERVLLVDDLLATGGTSAAALKLTRELGAEIVGALFFIELTFLEGRAALGDDVAVEALIRF
ncbi:MAG: adenine phosphoribosyltransferase [Verrucomicrobiae bacterium]|nr:adenine phosphoribosyltransferase [Verrucomicrobiae bacterium]MCP5539963.1 adenine phosphoribosyltransferase [Akkermansiaceae bacterium]MCP5549896.1 adenine phosphoribosyltransferase [Akkermansiaceae bacterium]